MYRANSCRNPRVVIGQIIRRDLGRLPLEGWNFGLSGLHFPRPCYVFCVCKCTTPALPPRRAVARIWSGGVAVLLLLKLVRQRLSELAPSQCGGRSPRPNHQRGSCNIWYVGPKSRQALGVVRISHSCSGVAAHPLSPEHPSILTALSPTGPDVTSQVVSRLL